MVLKKSNITLTHKHEKVRMTDKKIEAKTIIFVPKVDMASQTIKKALLKEYKFKKIQEDPIEIYINEETNALMAEILEDSIYAENIERSFKAELFIFATRHSAASEMPALLTHSPGNWTEEARWGGRPRAIAIAPATALKIAVIELKKAAERYRLEEYKVGLEVTHHGPYIDKTPTMFIELGSNEKYWKDIRGGVALADAIMKIAGERQKNRIHYKATIGLGGPHYAPHFTKKVLETEIAVGHIIPQYVYDKITEKEILMAIERNEEKVETVMLEWKGLKKHQREFSIKTLEKINQKWMRI